MGNLEWQPLHGQFCVGDWWISVYGSFEIRLYNQLSLVVYLSIYIGFLQKMQDFFHQQYDLSSFDSFVGGNMCVTTHFRCLLGESLSFGDRNSCVPWKTPFFTSDFPSTT